MSRYRSQVSLCANNAVVDGVITFCCAAHMRQENAATADIRKVLRAVFII